MKNVLFCVLLFAFLRGPGLVCPAQNTSPEDNRPPARDEAQLIISEVGDPMDYYKGRFVELYNTGTDTIDFDSAVWFLCRQANGSSWSDVQLTGTLPPANTYVIGYNVNYFMSAYGFPPDLSSGIITGNGDDGYFLFRDGDHADGQLFDAYGEINQDGTGTDWEYLDAKATRIYSSVYPDTAWMSGSWAVTAGSGVMDMTPGVHRVEITWTGIASGGWNDTSNWIFPGGQAFLPDASCNVTVPSNTPDQPVLSDPAYCHDLVFESDTLSSASIFGDEYLEVYGTVKVKVFLTGGAGVSRDDPEAVYHFVSSPMTSCRAIDVFPATAYVRMWDEPGQFWGNLTGQDSLYSGNGYSCWLQDGDTTISFEGDLVQDNVTPDLSFTTAGTPDPDLNGYNLVGNPFICGIDWDEGSWVKTGLDASIAVWSEHNGGYIYWNGTTGGITGGVIPPCQAFFVRANTASPSLTIPLDSKTLTTDPVYKDEAADLLVLHVRGNNGYADAAYIHFRGNATVAYDTEFDALKLSGLEHAPMVYTRSEGGERLAINSFPVGSENQQLEVEFESGFDGCFDMEPTGVGNFDPGTGIFLEDLFTGEIMDLRETEKYSFDHTPGNPLKRFLLSFTGLTGTGGTGMRIDRMHVCNNRVLIPDAPGNGRLQLFDMGGRLIRQYRVLPGDNRIDLQADGGIYILRLVFKGSMQSKKVIIN